MTPEALVKNGIKKRLDALGFWRAGAKRPDGTVVGWYFMPVSNGMGVHGIPDFICVWKGFAFDIEAKKKGGATTPNQDQRHLEIREGGGFVAVIDDPAKLDSVLLELEQHGRNLGREILGIGCGVGAGTA